MNPMKTDKSHEEAALERTAIRMLKENMSISFIAEVTGLGLEELKKLKCSN